MKFSIIIPTYNNLVLTKKCLIALRKNTNLTNAEIIVVDNASSDDTADFLKTQKDLRVIPNKKNRNFAGANNQAARVATGDILVFLNNDTEVHHGWLTAIGAVFEKEKNVGAVGVKLLFPDGSVQHAGVVISPDKTPRHIYHKAPADLPVVNKQRNFQAVTAACIATPKKVFTEMKGFDEAYKNGLEDVDLCLRVGKAGYRIVYTPDSVVTHHESVSPGRFRSNKPNADIYMSRWKDAVSDEHKYYKEDGKSALWILGQDLRSMSYGPNEYGTRPVYIAVLRWLYIPYQKTKTLFGFLAKGDLKGLIKKIESKFSHES